MSNIEVKFIRLECHKTEDSTGADEAYLKYNGEKIWGPTSINNGETVELGISRTLNGTARVDLYDEDSPDSDDHLGSIEITKDELDLGDRNQDFAEDDAYYTLYYKVRRE